MEIEVHAASLNPVDIQLMNLPIWNLPPMNYEKGVGCDFSGRILRAGSKSGLSVDDEVFGLQLAIGKAGSVADVLVLDTKATNVVIERKPPELTHRQAAALPLVFLTAKTCIAYAEAYVKDGETIGVLGGSSACGMLVCRLSKARGWNVVASCSSKNTQFVRSCGANQVVDYTQEPVIELFKAAKPRAIVDCVGGTDCIQLSPRYITIVGDKTNRSVIGGRMLYLTNPRMILRWLLGYFGYGARYDCITLEMNKEYLQEALLTKPENIVIDSTYTYEQLPEALEKLRSGNLRGKVVIDIAIKGTC